MAGEDFASEQAKERWTRWGGNYKSRDWKAGLGPARMVSYY